MKSRLPHLITPMALIAIWLFAFDAHAGDKADQPKQSGQTSEKKQQSKVEKAKDEETPKATPSAPRKSSAGTKTKTAVKTAKSPTAKKQVTTPEQKKSPSEKAPAAPKAKSAPTGAKPSVKFVDRDGDGIQDGKEHRFRRRIKSKGKDRREIRRRGGSGAQQGRDAAQKGPPSQ